jgi:hypothetical protein
MPSRRRLEARQDAIEDGRFPGVGSGLVNLGDRAEPIDPTGARMIAFIAAAIATKAPLPIYCAEPSRKTSLDR